MALTHRQNACYHLDNRLDMPMVRGGGLYVMRTYYRQQQHAHDELEFLYLMSGEVGWCLADGPTLHLAGGDMVLVQPHRVHGWEFDTVQPASFLWLSLDPSAPDALRHTPMCEGYLCDFADDLEQACGAVVRGDTRMSALFRDTRSALDNCQGEAAAGELAWLRSLIGQWILLLRKSLKQRTDHMESPEIAAAKTYMALHFDDVITLEQLASSAGISEGWLSERFVREVGLTPIDYLNRLRCAEARKMLGSTSLSVTEIAFRAGFSSSHYFATSFRKYTGMSPTNYRARVRETK